MKTSTNEKIAEYLPSISNWLSTFFQTGLSAANQPSTPQLSLSLLLVLALVINPLAGRNFANEAKEPEQTTPATNPALPQTAPQPEAAATNHASNIKGRVDGSLRQLLRENFKLNRGAVVTGDLFVPGTPSVRLSGNPNYGGAIDGTGSPQPTGYSVTINDGATLGRLVKRTNPIALAAVAPPPAAQGTRNVVITLPAHSYGDAATLRDLTLKRNAGPVAVPPGTYRNFAANDNSGFVFGVAGALEPSVYNLQKLTLKGSSTLQVVGPVIVTLGKSLKIEGAIVGASAKPNWLTLKFAKDGLTLNRGVFYGQVRAPKGTVTLNAYMTGSVHSHRLKVNSSGRLIAVSAEPASLQSITPGAGMQGQTLRVRLVGVNTHWRAGQTRASFGGGVSVSGSPAGELGAVTVINETSAEAGVTVAGNAEPATRDVRVVSQLDRGAVEEVSLSQSFSVVAATPTGARPLISAVNPNSGTPGTQVTLTGVNLMLSTAEPAITFAGEKGLRLPAFVKSASRTEVRVIIPNGAITGPIELTNSGGTIATAPFSVETEQSFQVTVAPSATTAVQRGSGTYVVYLTSNQSAFSQLATLTARGLPAGITGTFTPAQITAGASSTLTLNLSPAIAPGAYPFMIHGVANVSGHDLERTAGATLNVMTGGQTTLSGRVLSSDREPIIGATASLDGKTAMTDSAGAFLLTGVQAGTSRPLMIDGRTASSPNKSYPVIIEPANIVAGQANVNPYTFYLPPIDTQHEVEVVPGQNTNTINPRVPGLDMTIPADANLRNRDGSPIARVSITPLAIDRTPAPLPSNIKTAMVFTSQPGGAISDRPMPVTYPNSLGLDPGARVELYAFNHDTVQWYVYGFGRVSADGRTISPEIDPNTGRPYGLPDFSWHFPNASPEGNGGGGDGGCDSCPCTRGSSPVDFSTGIKFETVTDLSFGGARGGVTLSRFYSSDNSAQAIAGRFGRGWKDTYDIQLTGDWAAGGAGRVVGPDEQTGRLFSYRRTDGDGTLVFDSTATIGKLGDIIRKLTDGTFEYRYRSGDLMRFNIERKLISVSDSNGNTTSLSYSGANLTQITDPVGRTVILAYDSSGRVIKLVDPLGREWNYTYDSSVAVGILETVSDPLGGVTRYGYTNLRLTSIKDPRGNVVKLIAYDSAGRVASQQFADGGIERYDYELSGGMVSSTTITDALSHGRTMRFNASGYVIGQTDALGQSSTIERDLGTNLPISTTGPCGCPEVTRQFDARGNVTSITDRLGRTESYEYEPLFNNVVKETDKLGHVTLYSYDLKGNLTSYTEVTRQENFTTTFGYSDQGEKTHTIDPLGRTTRFDYDAQGNMTALIDPLGNRSTFEYDGIGRQTATSDPLLRRTTMAYNKLYLTEITDPALARTRFEYDENGNLISQSDALQHRWRWVFDPKNRLKSVVDPLGRVSKVTYTRADELSTVVSASGRTTRFLYDKRSQPISITDPIGGIVRMSYDNRGNLLTFADQKSNTTTYSYDELFRPISARDPLGRVSTVEYDASNRLVSAVDRLGRRTSMQYDERNRLTRIVLPDATLTYVYDAASRLTRIDDSQSGSIQWAYDSADNLLSETTPAGILSYSYNQAGERVTMAAGNRPVVNYGYDVAGRLRTINQGADTFTYSYNIVSRLTSLARPNGIRTTYDSDELNRLTRLRHETAGGSPLEDFQLTYNRDDEIESITSLASATMLPGANNASAANAANRIGQFGNATYAFDDMGQTTSKTDAHGTTNYEWDTRGRLTKVTLPGNQIVNYSYDALGRRTGVSSDGLATTLLYDGHDVVFDRGSDGNTVDYVNGLRVDEKLMQRSGATSLYFLADHLGSTAALTDAGGNVSERAQYQPFGASSVSQLTRYGFTGRETEPRTGLIYYRSRWYDPQQGRFLSEDPIGPLAGLNLYSYVGNYPVGLRDPYGLFRLTNPLAPLPGLIPPPVPIPPPVVAPAASGAVTGGAAFGGASAGTVAAAVVVSFAVGYAIGRGIGHIPVPFGNGRTVDEAVQDAMLDTIGRLPPFAPLPEPRPQPEQKECDRRRRPREHKTCRVAYDACIDNPWVKDPNTGKYKHLECPDCYANCQKNGGVWPTDKCPR